MRLPSVFCSENSVFCSENNTISAMRNRFRGKALAYNLKRL